MARGKTFGQIVTATRAEAGHSTSASAGRNVSDQIKHTVRRVYERLHGDYPWPHLFTTRDITLDEGATHYAFHADLDADRVGRVWYKMPGESQWCPLEYGIGAEHWSRPGGDERCDPVMRWQRYNDDMIQVWPRPKTGGGTLRMEGMTLPRPLLEDGDKVDLDDQMISLYAAAEILARQRSADAELKLDQATSRYMKLRAQQSASDPVFRLNPTRETRPAGIHIRAPGT
jgi:hypothetical protein